MPKKAIALISSTFVKKFDSTLARVGDRLADYLDRPEDKGSIHDIRTSIRRLEASFSILPKSIRKKNMEKMGKYKQFFRVNSEIRDLDIIASKISMIPDTKILAKLREERKTKIILALELARALRSQPEIVIGKEKMPAAKLEKRLYKVISALEDKIQKRLPVVISSSRKKKDLHELRKDYKKLRYILEIVPKDHISKYARELSIIVGGKPASRTTMNRLKDLQDILGSIHDSDVIIDYLRKTELSPKVIGALIESERDNRSRLYQKFVGSLNLKSD